MTMPGIATVAPEINEGEGEGLLHHFCCVADVTMCGIEAETESVEEDDPGPVCVVCEDLGPQSSFCPILRKCINGGCN